ncbi:MAG: DUF2088 domain-containing protein [Spirochaetia bacterium]|jgi:hypothetical protein
MKANASTPLPRLASIKRSFDPGHIEDIEGAVRAALEGAGAAIRPGASVAIAVGSRGIANLSAIVRETVRHLKRKGALPFIVPAMGSHGGATAEGQEAILAGYGITEEGVGAPVRSSMEVVEIPRGDLPVPVYMDRLAWQSDGIVLINRVKPHTDYHGMPESGLMKMAVIGLGKHAQALVIHAHGVNGLKTLISPIARRIFATGKILLGLGIVENAYDQTLLIRAVLPGAIEEVERGMLEMAQEHVPVLPFRNLDVLIVDQMGKDISGVGLDPNIIGRIRVFAQEEPAWPVIKTIVVTDLTDASHGNALGMGLADIITRRLQEKIDFRATYENLVTSTFLERGKMPMVAETDRQALEVALRTSWITLGEEPRVARIKNTLRLERMHVSRIVLEEIRGRETVEVLGDFRDSFDDAGFLVPFEP